MTLDRLRWWEADPGRLVMEHDELNDRHGGFSVALDDSGRIVFEGQITVTIAGTAGLRLPLSVRCPDGFPAVAPKVVDSDDRIPVSRRGSHRWHVNHDGSLCFADPNVWSPQYTVADLVDKVIDWMANTLALELGLLEEMPSNGRLDVSGLEVALG